MAFKTQAIFTSGALFFSICCFAQAPEKLAAPDLSKCGFDKFDSPKDAVILAAGSYSGTPLDFQIDQSGGPANLIDVTVNHRNSPAILMLGAYEPTVWNVRWTKETKIAAVWMSGNGRQVAAGLPKNIPQLVTTILSTPECETFYVDARQAEAVANASKKVLGQGVQKIYVAKNGKVTIGEEPEISAEFVSSPEVSVRSYYDPKAPLAGLPGLDDAEQKGSIRRATDADFEAWEKLVIAKRKEKGGKELPEVVGGEDSTFMTYREAGLNAYVILKDFTFPEGLYGGYSAIFFLPAGVTAPKGNPGHSDVLNLADGTCLQNSPVCNLE